jgi:hypothetical protein
MRYINFITDEKVLSELKGSTPERLVKLEHDLGHELPLALKEYLLLMGEQTCLYDAWDEHGTNDMVMLKDWLYEWISKYRAQGIALKGIEQVLPFYDFQDTFFYVPLEDNNDDPAVYAFDINDKPTVRRLDDSFSEFVRRRYERKTTK